jgi:hypothetical protein
MRECDLKSGSAPRRGFEKDAIAMNAILTTVPDSDFGLKVRSTQRAETFR